MAEQLEIPGVADGGADDRPGWDDYWMPFAKAAKARSNDPSCKVGAVIVRDNLLISSGYNGLARGVTHHERRMVKEPGSPEKLRWMCHAEQNAIFNAARTGVSLQGGKLYTTKFPCLLCANAIVQAGIIAVHTRDTKPYDDELMKDDGWRVIQVLLETGVRLEAPCLETDIAILRRKPKGAQRAGQRRRSGTKRDAQSGAA